MKKHVNELIQVLSNDLEGVVFCGQGKMSEYLLFQDEDGTPIQAIPFSTDELDLAGYTLQLFNKGWRTITVHHLGN